MTVVRWPAGNGALMDTVEIDAERLLQDLRSLREIGREGRGVNRPTYSPPDMEARHWLVGRMAAAGLEAGLDGIGSVFGRRPVDGPAVLAGSHLETLGHAGWLDGVYGVVCGLEASRALSAAPGYADCAVDVMAFADEEAHYGSFLGSRSFIGALSEAEIDAATGRADGKPLRRALAEAGLAGRPRLLCPPGRYGAFLEAHIEQGDRLEGAAARIGVVSAIVASRLYRLVFTGQANHAGTTSMARRRDAGRAALRALAAIDDRLGAGLAGEHTVWTVGRMTLEPGTAAVIPGRAEVLYQVRDPARERLEDIAQALGAEARAAAAELRCSVDIACLASNDGATMDPGLRTCLAAAAQARVADRWMELPSGAGHDAQHLARIMPAAMLFVPSIGGISHHPDEDTSEDDLVEGARVFTDAAAMILDLARNRSDRTGNDGG